MNDVVGKASEGIPCSVEDDFHFIGCGVSPDLLENIGGVILTQHSASPHL